MSRSPNKFRVENQQHREIGHLANEKPERISFIFQEEERHLPAILLNKSPYFKDVFFQQPSEERSKVKIAVPKWVSPQVYEIFAFYLETGNVPKDSDSVKKLTQQSTQRLLWLGDYFQLEKFQEKCINEIIIPNITKKNVLTFLLEAFKKLKACEESNDNWYSLLNTCMNFISKHLLEIHQESREDLQKVNSKIFEEITERTLRVFRAQNNWKNVIDLFLNIKGISNPFEALHYRRKALLNKKINFATHPSIGWKLSKLKTLREKETHSFKFNGYYWKLVARSEEDLLGRKLRIFIRTEGKIMGENKNGNQMSPRDESSQMLETDEKGVNKVPTWREELRKETEKVKSSDESSDVLTIYYQIKINGVLLSKDISFNHISMKNSKECLLWEFSSDELDTWSQSDSSKKGDSNQKSGASKEVTEFNIFINTDMLYPSLIQYISLNLDKYMDEKSFILVDQRDVKSIIENLPQNIYCQEIAFIFVIKWVYLKYEPNKNGDHLFTLFDYNNFDLEFLSMLCTIKRVRQLSFFKLRIENRLIYLLQTSKEDHEINQNRVLSRLNSIFGEGFYGTNDHFDLNSLNDLKYIRRDIQQMSDLGDTQESIVSSDRKNYKIEQENKFNLERGNKMFSLSPFKKSCNPVDQSSLTTVNGSNVFQMDYSKVEQQSVNLKTEMRPPLHPADDSLNCLPKNKLGKLKKSRLGGSSIFRGCGSMTNSVETEINMLGSTGENTEMQNIRSIIAEKARNKKPDFYQTQSKMFSPNRSPMRDRNSVSLEGTPVSVREKDGVMDFVGLHERLISEKELRKKDIMKNLDIQRFISPYANWMQKELKNI